MVRAPQCREDDRASDRSRCPVAHVSRTKSTGTNKNAVTSAWMLVALVMFMARDVAAHSHVAVEAGLTPNISVNYATERFSGGIGFDFRRENMKVTLIYDGIEYTGSVAFSVLSPVLTLRLCVAQRDDTRIYLVARGAKHIAFGDSDERFQWLVEGAKDSNDDFGYSGGLGAKTALGSRTAIGGEVAVSVNAVRGSSHRTITSSEFNIYVQLLFGTSG